jgi:hypothetical protein
VFEAQGFVLSLLPPHGPKDARRSCQGAPVGACEVLGHALENTTDQYGKGQAGYRQAGTGLAIAKGTVEKITYEGLRL